MINSVEVQWDTNSSHQCTCSPLFGTVYKKRLNVSLCTYIIWWCMCVRTHISKQAHVQVSFCLLVTVLGIGTEQRGLEAGSGGGY